MPKSRSSAGRQAPPQPQQITFSVAISPSSESIRDFHWNELLSIGKTCIHCWFQRYSRRRQAKIHTLEDARRCIRPQWRGDSQAEKAAVALYGLATGTQRWAFPETIDGLERYLDLHPDIITVFRILSGFYRHQFHHIDQNNSLAETNCGLVIKLDRGTEPDRPSWTHLSYLYDPRVDRLLLVRVERINNLKIDQLLRRGRR